MGNITYSMDKLAESAEFEALKAVNNFSCPQEYFDRLNDFSENSHEYLRAYNPTVVIYMEEERRCFLNDLEKTKDIFASLEMAHALTELENIKNAVHSGKEKELADGLVKLHAIAKMASAGITSASELTPQDPEKPIILAVDDNQALLTVIVGVLESKYRVVAVTNADAALMALNKLTPALFLLDIEMPVMDGYELTKKIRENDKFKDSPIIFLSGNSERKYVTTAMECGGKDYILKPVNKDLLLKKIGRQLRS